MGAIGFKTGGSVSTPPSGGGALPTISGGTDLPFSSQGDWNEDGLQGLLNSYQDAYGKALNYNQGQYEQGMAGYTALMKDLPDKLTQIGEYQKNMSDAKYAKQGYELQRSGLGFGIGNRTVMDSLQQGIGAQNDYNKKQIANDIGVQQLSLNQTLANQQLGLLERYQKPLPDYGVMAGLAGDINSNAFSLMMGGGGGRGGGGGSGGGGGAQQPTYYYDTAASALPRNMSLMSSSIAGTTGPHPIYWQGKGIPLDKNGWPL